METDFFFCCCFLTFLLNWVKWFVNTSLGYFVFLVFSHIFTPVHPHSRARVFRENHRSKRTMETLHDSLCVCACALDHIKSPSLTCATSRLCFCPSLIKLFLFFFCLGLFRTGCKRLLSSCSLNLQKYTIKFIMFKQKSYL